MGKKFEGKPDPEDGLKPQGPLNRGISTMKVGMRPPDIPMTDRLEQVLENIRKEGSGMPHGSCLCIRSIDGFVQFLDIDSLPLDKDSSLRVVEFDPSRGVFLVGGDGRADVRTEIAWYVFRAVPEAGAVLFVSNKGKDEEIPVEREARSKRMLDIAADVGKEGTSSAFGYHIAAMNDMKDLAGIDMPKGAVEDEDQSKSQ